MFENKSIQSDSQGFWCENASKRNAENTKKAGDFASNHSTYSKFHNESRGDETFERVPAVKFLMVKLVLLNSAGTARLDCKNKIKACGRRSWLIPAQQVNYFHRINLFETDNLFFAAIP